MFNLIIIRVHQGVTADQTVLSMAHAATITASRADHFPDSGARDRLRGQTSFATSDTGVKITLQPVDNRERTPASSMYGLTNGRDGEGDTPMESLGNYQRHVDTLSSHQ